MSDAAQNTSRVMGRLRSSFTDPMVLGGRSSFSPVPSTSPSAPQLNQNMSVASPAVVTEVVTQAIPTVMTPVVNSEVHEQLDILDRVLAEVEQQAQAEAQAQFQSQVQQAPAAAESIADQQIISDAAIVQEVPSIQSSEIGESPVVPAEAGFPAMIQPAQAAAVPLAVDQAVADLNKVYAGSAKESLSAAPTVIESGSGYQMVEQLPSPEQPLPVEVEGFIQHVEDHQDQLPQEIVIADGTLQFQPAAVSMRPVVVLPITPEVEAVGEKKNSKWSVRWLVEWSHKLMKMFGGNIIYKEV